MLAWLSSSSCNAIGPLYNASAALVVDSPSSKVDASLEHGEPSSGALDLAVGSISLITKLPPQPIHISVRASAHRFS